MNVYGSRRLIQRIEKGCRCDELGCYNLADWSVAFADYVYDWCSTHTKGHMEDRDFWLVKVRTQAGR